MMYFSCHRTKEAGSYGVGALRAALGYLEQPLAARPVVQNMSIAFRRHVVYQACSLAHVPVSTELVKLPF